MLLWSAASPDRWARCLPEFRATFQAGIVGDRLAAGSAQIDERTGDLNKLAAGANTLADSLGDVRAQVNQIAPSIQSLLDAFSSMKTKYGGDKLVRDVEAAAKLVKAVNRLGNAMGINFAAVKDMFAWIGPVLTALQGNPVCNADPSCTDTRNQFERFAAARDDGSSRRFNEAARQLQGSSDTETLTATVNKLNGALASVVQGGQSRMGWTNPAARSRAWPSCKQGADRLAGGSREVAGGVDQLVEQIKVMAAGLNQASAFLLTMRSDAADPSMAGFNIPPEVLGLADFKKAADGVHLAGRPLGAVPGANQTQPVQLRGDGSGQHDQ